MEKRRLILEWLHGHKAWDKEEERMRVETLNFVGSNRNCLLRSNLAGHITGSALILDETGKRVLLMHHRKLGLWLQPGGHSDGEPDTRLVALRESREETGLTSLRVESGKLFDVDVHPIPARKTEPRHFHYDLRFVLRADSTEPLQRNNESKDLLWVPLEEVRNYNDQWSVIRMVERILSAR